MQRERVAKKTARDSAPVERATPTYGINQIVSLAIGARRLLTRFPSENVSLRFGAAPLGRRRLKAPY